MTASASKAHLEAMISPIQGTCFLVARWLLSWSKLMTDPLNMIWGMMSSGMVIYMVATELNEDDMFRPSTLAKQDTEKSTIQ